MIVLTITRLRTGIARPKTRCPASSPKAIWLLIILFTATIAAIGPIVWLALRWVSRAEKKQTRAPKAPKRPTAPDDDPEFLFRLERDIQRKRREEERRRREQGQQGKDGDGTED